MIKFILPCLSVAALHYFVPSAAQNNVVCTVHDFQSVTRTGVNQYYYSQLHYARRGGWWRRRTYTYYRQQSAYRTVAETALTTKLKQVCCTGYEPIPGSPQLNCRPKCDQPCQNGGNCTAPNTCTCNAPYIAPDCTNVACTSQHPCFPGLCRQTTSTSLTCQCPKGFSGTNCKTNANGPVLDDCYLIVKHPHGRDVTTNCRDRSSVFINLSYITSLEPRVTIEYTGPEYIPHISYIADHWFGLQTCAFLYSVNSFSSPRRNAPIPPRMMNYTLNVSLPVNKQLNHGDRLTLKIDATSGGYRLVQPQVGNAINESFSNGHEEFTFNMTVDRNPPVHCTNMTPPCNDSHVAVVHDSTPNELNTQLDFTGWSDDVAGVAQYIYEVHEVETKLLLASSAWNTSHVPVKFHRSPYLSYRIKLTVVDAAGNTQTAPDLFVAPLLIVTTEKTPVLTTPMSAIIGVVTVLVVGALAALGYFVKTKVDERRKKQKDFILRLGREVNFRVGERKQNNFAEFRLCTVTKSEIEHEAIAKFLSAKPTEEDLMIMKNKKDFWEAQGFMHPNVLHYYGFQDGPNGPILAFEYCETGSLNQLLREIRNSEVDEPTIERLEHISTQVALGMKYLHQRGILHTKLTTRHVLLSNKSGARLNNYPHPYCAKIVGFDPSKPRGRKPMRWLAPEVAGDGPTEYTYESDVYNFATFLLEVFSLGADPWQECKTHQEAQAAALKGIKPERPEYCSMTIYEEVICPATDLEPGRRPTMYEIARSLDYDVCEGIYGDVYTEGITIEVEDIYYEPGADSRDRPQSGIYY